MRYSNDLVLGLTPKRKSSKVNHINIKILFSIVYIFVMLQLGEFAQKSKHSSLVIISSILLTCMLEKLDIDQY